MSHFDFNQNRDCEYFPCHDGANPETFSCLFCYCPLYTLCDQCGGNFRFLADGTKDCSHCLIPHSRDNYDKIMKRMPAVIDLARKKISAGD